VRLALLPVRQRERIDRPRGTAELQTLEQRLAFCGQPLPVDVDLVYPVFDRNVHLRRGHATRYRTDRHSLEAPTAEGDLFASSKGQMLGDPGPDLSLDLLGPELACPCYAYRRPGFAVLVGATRGTRFRFPQREAVGTVEHELLAFDYELGGMRSKHPPSPALVADPDVVLP
jgi:hypothetical protein